MSIANGKAEPRLTNSVTPGVVARDVAKKRTRNPLVRYSLMLLRRSHLYFGLLLVPWALLYGITAYLFNHPTHFSSNESTSVTPKQSLTDSLGADAWNPASRARTIHQELQKRFESEGQQIELLNVPAPKFQGTHVSTSFDWGDRSYNISMPVEGTRIAVRIAPRRKETAVSRKAFFEVEGSDSERDMPKSPKESASAELLDPATRGRTAKPEGPADSPGRFPLRIDEDLAEKIRCYTAEIALNLDPSIEIKPSDVKVNSVPELIFETQANDERWACKHNALSGAVRTQMVQTNTDGNDFSWRRYLLRLHTAHTYPNEGGVRWYWAVVVDVMAFVMVFWGISGLVMWWQIKSTRRFGTFAMAVSLLSATWLFVEMFRILHG